jgi:hypothetical protein
METRIFFVFSHRPKHSGQEEAKMYEPSDATGLCEKNECKIDGAANISGVNLCLFHFAEEMGLTEQEARRYLKEIRITPPKASVALPPVSGSTGLSVAELGF